MLQITAKNLSISKDYHCAASTNKQGFVSDTRSRAKMQSMGHLFQKKKMKLSTCCTELIFGLADSLMFGVKT
jgi:hypothetical protein